jgi:flagellar hook-associated protein 3 FlgL
VFGGQGSAGNPMTGAASPAYAPAAGQQRIGEDGRYAVTVDGRSSFMAVPQGNGVFVTASAAANTGTGWIDPGSVADPTQLTGHDYRITVAGAPGALTYSVADLTAGSTLASNVPYSAGTAINIAGQRVTLDGAPAAGDSFNLGPAGQQSVFQTLDQAIALLENPASTKDHEGLQRVQTSLDRALDGMIFTRSRVGADLRHVENAAALGEQQELGVTERRSNLQDLDLARGISDLQATQTGLEAALKSYTSLSRNSLFTLMG